MWPFGSPNIERLKKNFDYKGLAKALGHREAAVRKRAAEALTFDERTVQLFRDALKGANASEFFKEAAALTRKRTDAVVLSDTSASDLWSDLSGEAITMLSLPARILGKAFAAEAIGPLISALGDKDPTVRAQAATALGRLGTVARIFAQDDLMEPFSKLIASLDAGAGKVLRTLWNEKARIAEKLMALASDHDGLVRNEADTALRQFTEGQKSAARGEPAIQVRRETEGPSTVVSCHRCGTHLERLNMARGAVTFGGSLPVLYGGVVCEVCRKIECSACKGSPLEAPCGWCGGRVSPAYENLLE